MIPLLQQHPFPVEAHFDRSVVLGFALPRETLEPLLPACLRLDTYDDRWGFLAVAMVRTQDLRPAGFPRWVGRDFSLLGYRIFVRYRNGEGRNLRGLYILRSETDRFSMQVGGNLFTGYNYHRTDVRWQLDAAKTRIVSSRSGLDVTVVELDREIALPPGSPFPGWTEARRFAGPLPYTFSVQSAGREVVVIKGTRSNWQPRPVAVDAWQVGFLARRGLNGARLANAFVVRGISYRWERGRRESLAQECAVR